MRLIELHILQSFPVTCLNRDDVGAPKSAIFGGAIRARVSSQCWKRAIRQLAAELRPQNFAGKRGYYMAARLQAAIEDAGIEPQPAREAAEEIVAFLGKQDTKSTTAHKTHVALYLSPMELAAIAQAVAEDLKKGGKADVKKGTLKRAIAAASPTDLADIAIFGRMVANDHTLMVEGAGMFSHALSTHHASSEIDFFSAVDDLRPEESEGAGHIGTLEFNSACYYRYVGLNWDLLCDADHLGHFSADDRRAVAGAFLQAAIRAIPNARRNSMFGHNPPQYVLGVVRQGQPISLVNAFEQPVRSSNGYVQPSIDALEKHYREIQETYGLDASCEARIPADSLDVFVKTLLGAEILAHA